MKNGIKVTLRDGTIKKYEGEFEVYWGDSAVFLSKKITRVNNEVEYVSRLFSRKAHKKDVINIEEDTESIASFAKDVVVSVEHCGK